VSTPPTSASSPAVKGEEGHPASFSWRRSWYPVSFVEDLVEDAPTAFTLLGEPLVLWKDGEGEWQAAADRCPHRLAPLSEGRVSEAGHIECGYHGWAFDASGRCTAIPQMEQGSTALSNALHSKRSCVAVYPTAVAQGLLWVLPTVKADAPSPLPALPIVPEIDEPDCVCQDIARDLPYDHATLLENVLDVSHVPFTHHGSVGRRQNATPVGLTVDTEKAGPQGFVGLWEEGPRSGKYGSQYTEFVAPTLMRHKLVTPAFTTLTVVYATPTAPGKCRLFARFPFIFKAALPRMLFPLVPRWYSHIGQNAILEDDQIFLHEQERFVEADATHKGHTYSQSCYMPSAADAYVQAFRNWLTEHAEGRPPWPAGVQPALPPRQSREELLDRYHSHTANCRSCSAALANLVRARKALRVASLVSLAACAALVARSAPVYLAVVAGVASAGLALLREQLGDLVRKMHQGPYPPPRRPPSVLESALAAASAL